MTTHDRRIPPLFVSQFSVDYAAPFRRYLNRLEVEIGQEDYRHLKRVELVPAPPADFFAEMQDITERLLATTQNHYNRELLASRGIRVFLDPASYRVYYRLADKTICFRPWWREQVLDKFFPSRPQRDSGWRYCSSVLPGFEVRFLPDDEGGALLLRNSALPAELPLLTATHGPYDPFTLEVALYFLRSGKGRAALVNLGFAGREPLTDENLDKLKSWGVPLNPSNIDVIYPYLDDSGAPCCYKMERRLGELVAELAVASPGLILDIHGCVGTEAADHRIVVGLGGLPPYPDAERLGRVEAHGRVLHLFPARQLHYGLGLVRELSDQIYLQYCTSEQTCFQFALLGQLQLVGRRIDLQREVASLLEGEERSYLPADQVRWLPGAGANALQRSEAAKLDPEPLCLHVEIPTAIRKRMVLKLRELAITASLESSGL